MLNNYYGLDLLLTERGEPVVLELNGVLALFAAACRAIYGDDRTVERLFGRMVAAADAGTIFQESRLLCPRHFRRLAAARGVAYRQFRRSRFARARREAGTPVGLVIGARYHPEQFADLEPRLLVNPLGVERTANDKALTLALVLQAGLGCYQPPSLTVGGQLRRHAALDRFLATLPADSLLILKPVLGYGGRGIRVLRRVDLLPALETIGPSDTTYLVQRYVHSKPIRSTRTGRLHAACARVICFNGFLEAYWRLAPAPLESAASPEQRLVASISRGGQSEAMNDSDKETFARCAERIIDGVEESIGHQQLDSDARIDAAAADAYRRLARGSTGYN